MRSFVLHTAMLLVLVSGACGDAKDVYSPCASNDDCREELFCARGGILKGHCAEACEQDSRCVNRHGDIFFCVSGVCVQECTDTADCPGGLTCDKSQPGGAAYHCATAP